MGTLQYLNGLSTSPLCELQSPGQACRTEPEGGSVFSYLRSTFQVAFCLFLVDEEPQHGTPEWDYSVIKTTALELLIVLVCFFIPLQWLTLLYIMSMSWYENESLWTVILSPLQDHQGCIYRNSMVKERTPAALRSMVYWVTAREAVKKFHSNYPLFWHAYWRPSGSQQSVKYTSATAFDSWSEHLLYKQKAFESRYLHIT